MLDDQHNFSKPFTVLEIIRPNRENFTIFTICLRFLSAWCMVCLKNLIVLLSIQAIPRILRNPEVRPLVHNSRQKFRVLNQMHTTHGYPTYLRGIIFMLFLRQYLTLPIVCCFNFPKQQFLSFLSMCATYFAHHTLFGLIIVIPYAKDWKSSNFSLRCSLSNIFSLHDLIIKRTALWIQVIKIDGELNCRSHK
jgi:hypothetical protein